MTYTPQHMELQKESIDTFLMWLDLNHIKFFNTSQVYKEQSNPKRLNDEERVPSYNDGTESNPIDKGDDDYVATFIEENAHPEGNTHSIHDSVSSEGETNHLDKELTKMISLSMMMWLSLLEAPRKWNEKLVCVLSECGFTQSLNDHSLFVKSPNNVFIALLVYADDIIISGNDLKETDMFKKIQIKDLGKLKYFLGIKVLEFDNAICLSQRKYCIELLHEFGMLGCKPTSMHMEPNTVLNFKVNDDDPALENIIGYQKLVGKLIYLTHTRPDIAYFVHCLSQHVHYPLKSHLQAALNVLRYLKSFPGKGLRYDHSLISFLGKGLPR
ncbi:ribonuclease H-like domain-containing protein [Tanacetum coccineum]